MWSFVLRVLIVLGVANSTTLPDTKPLRTLRLLCLEHVVVSDLPGLLKSPLMLELTSSVGSALAFLAFVLMKRHLTDFPDPFSLAFWSTHPSHADESLTTIECSNASGSSATIGGSPPTSHNSPSEYDPPRSHPDSPSDSAGYLLKPGRHDCPFFTASGASIHASLGQLVASQDRAILSILNGPAYLNQNTSIAAVLKEHALLDLLFQTTGSQSSRMTPLLLGLIKTIGMLCDLQPKASPHRRAMHTYLTWRQHTDCEEQYTYTELTISLIQAIIQYVFQLGSGHESVIDLHEHLPKTDHRRTQLVTYLQDLWQLPFWPASQPMAVVASASVQGSWFMSSQCSTCLDAVAYWLEHALQNRLVDWDSLTWRLNIDQAQSIVLSFFQSLAISGLALAVSQNYLTIPQAVNPELIVTLHEQLHCMRMEDMNHVMEIFTSVLSSVKDNQDSFNIACLRAWLAGCHPSELTIRMLMTKWFATGQFRTPLFFSFPRSLQLAILQTESLGRPLLAPSINQELDAVSCIDKRLLLRLYALYHPDKPIDMVPNAICQSEHSELGLRMLVHRNKNIQVKIIDNGGLLVSFPPNLVTSVVIASLSNAQSRFCWRSISPSPMRKVSCLPGFSISLGEIFIIAPSDHEALRVLLPQFRRSASMHHIVDEHDMSLSTYEDDHALSLGNQQADSNTTTTSTTTGTTSIVPNVSSTLISTSTTMSAVNLLASSAASRQPVDDLTLSYFTFLCYEGWIVAQVVARAQLFGD